MSRYKVRNWSEYNQSLVNRGSLNLWISEDAMRKWRPKKDPHFIGAPRKYSDDAILCLMMVKMVYHLPYRNLMGFIVSIFQLLKSTLPVPHFTTIADRARSLGKQVLKLSKKKPTDLVFDASGFKVFGEGEWKVRQHGKDKRRRWKKFVIGICPNSHEIILAEATELEEAECKIFPRLLSKAPKTVKKVIGDGAYDTLSCHKACYEREITLLAPPRKGAVVGREDHLCFEERNNAIKEIIGLGNGEEGLKLWKKLKGYHRRSLVETAFSRFKKLFSSVLFSKRIDTQSVELMIKAMAMNIMTRTGMPKGVMIK